MKPSRRAIAGCAALLITSTIGAFAYETNTHSAISFVALTRDDCLADSYLKNELLLDDGIDTFASDSGSAEI